MGRVYRIGQAHVAQADILLLDITFCGERSSALEFFLSFRNALAQQTKTVQVIGRVIPTRLLVAPGLVLTGSWIRVTLWCVSRWVITSLPQWAQIRYRTQHGL